jgi:periplasmic divalent cation tolerance protein
MKGAGRYALVLVTAPNPRVAQQLAKAALEARLVACANLVPGIHSFYWWQGRIESGKEVLLLLKTTRRTLPALEKLIVSEHPYDAPEFLVLPLISGSARYLNWIDDSLRSRKRPK